MNKAGLIESIAQKTGGSKRSSEKALNAVLDAISETLASGERVQLVGFGTFEVRERKERAGRNPQTNERIPIAPTRTPYFKPGKLLKDSVSAFPTY